MFQFGGAWSFVWGLSPQKPPWRWDWARNQFGTPEGAILEGIQTF